MNFGEDTKGFPGSSAGKEATCNAGDPVSIPGLVEKIPWKEEWQHTPALTLAWRIPWTEKPGGLQSMGLQGAGHD